MKETFEAKESLKITSEDGEINHGEARIGNSMIMFGNASEKIQPFPAMLHL